MFGIKVTIDELWDFMSVFDNLWKWKKQCLILKNCFTFCVCIYLSLCMYNLRSS